MLRFGIGPAKCYIQGWKTFIYIQHVTFDIAYAQCYNIKHSESVLLYCFNDTGIVTFDQFVHNQYCQKPLLYSTSSRNGNPANGNHLDILGLRISLFCEIVTKRFQKRPIKMGNLLLNSKIPVPVSRWRTELRNETHRVGDFTLKPRKHLWQWQRQLSKNLILSFGPLLAKISSPAAMGFHALRWASMPSLILAPWFPALPCVLSGRWYIVAHLCSCYILHRVVSTYKPSK